MCVGSEVPVQKCPDGASNMACTNAFAWFAPSSQHGEEREHIDVVFSRLVALPITKIVAARRDVHVVASGGLNESSGRNCSVEVFLDSGARIQLRERDARPSP